MAAQIENVEKSTLLYSDLDSAFIISNQWLKLDKSPDSTFLSYP
jgi:hypothetical protein